MISYNFKDFIRIISFLHYNILSFITISKAAKILHRDTWYGTYRICVVYGQWSNWLLFARFVLARKVERLFLI